MTTSDISIVDQSRSRLTATAAGAVDQYGAKETKEKGGSERE